MNTPQSLTRMFRQKGALVAVFLLLLQLFLLGVPLFFLWPTRQATAAFVVECPLCVKEATFEAYVAKVVPDTALSTVKNIATAFNTAGGLKALIEAATDRAINFALKVAFNALKKQLLNMIVNDIVRWINGQGKPRFVTDWQGFLKKAADNAGGLALDELGGGFLCEPFSVQIRILLAPVKKFPERARCSISDVVKNVDSFFQNFRNGGWRAWITVSTQPQNNIYGAYLLTIDENITRQFAAKEAAQAEAIAGKGFLSQQVCLQWRLPGGAIQTGEIPTEQLPLGARCEKPDIRTPGSTIGELGSKALALGPESLVSAKEFSEYVGAIVNAAINRVIREGLSVIGVKTPPISAEGPEIHPPESVNIAGEQASAPQLVLAQANLLSTLEEQLIPAEQKLSLELLELERVQSQVLTTVAQLSDNACRLADLNFVKINVGAPITISVDKVGKLTLESGKAVNPQMEATTQLANLNQINAQHTQQVETLLPIASGTVSQYIEKLKAYTKAIGTKDEKTALNDALANRSIAYKNSRDAIFSPSNDESRFLQTEPPSILVETQNDAAAAGEQVTNIQARIGDEAAGTGIFAEIAAVREKKTRADALLASCVPIGTTTPATRFTP